MEYQIGHYIEDHRILFVDHMKIITSPLVKNSENTSINICYEKIEIFKPGSWIRAIQRTNQASSCFS